MAERSCPACGFDGTNLSTLEYHKGHRAQHIAKFPRSDARTIATLDRMVELAERDAFAPRAV